MKINKKLMLGLIVAPSLLLGSCNKTSNAASTSTPTSNNGTTTKAETVKIWVSEVDGIADLFKTLCNQFNKDNNLNYTYEVVGVTEAESATQMLTSVSDGADIYCFAQDQFSRLVEGGALSKLGVKASEFVKENNTAASAAACASGSDYYAYPLTADNGYFMYYNKEVITDESHLDSLEDLIQDCEDAGYNFSMETNTSAWYLASFFMAYDKDMKQLCHSNWTTDEKGKFTGVDDTYNSDNGVIASRGIQKLVKSTASHSSSTTSDLDAATKSAVLVSGTWAYTDVKNILGDNMGVAPLPSFTVDGNKYHMGSYTGYKLMGVKPQSDAVKASNLHKLAQYLTGYDGQMQRLKEAGWGPSNKKAQESDEFKNNPALSALAIQNTYATTQGQIHGSWWDIAKVIADGLKEAETDNVTQIKAVLQKYEDDINNLFSMTEEEKRAFTIIGKIASKNTDWKLDLPMTETTTNTWVSDPIEFTEGDEFKCRQGKGWDVSFGDGGENFKITAENAGTKKVQLVTTVDASGNVTDGTITLID